MIKETREKKLNTANRFTHNQTILFLSDIEFATGLHARQLNLCGQLSIFSQRLADESKGSSRATAMWTTYFREVGIEECFHVRLNGRAGKNATLALIQTIVQLKMKDQKVNSNRDHLLTPKAVWSTSFIFERITSCLAATFSPVIL